MDGLESRTSPQSERHIPRTERAARLCVRMVAFKVAREVLGIHEKAIQHLRLEGDDLFDIALKAATDPATTTVPEWAGALVGNQVGAFLDSLGEFSVYSRLAAMSPLRVVAATTKIPTRDESKRIPFAFVGESAPIPVGGAVIQAWTVGPHKLAGVSVMTAELARASNFEQVLRVIMTEDAQFGVDSVLLGSSAGTAIAPAGLLNGVTPIPSTGTAAGDVAALLGAIGYARRPAIIANSKKAAALGAFLGVNPTLSASLGLILSPSVPDETLIALDAWDFGTAIGDALDIDVSTAPAIHLEDTTPLPIVSGGTPASPVTSLWQQDMIGYRLIWPVSWAMRRAGSVAAVTDAAW